MLKVECESCKAPYQIDERRVPPAGLKMRCPKCGHSFLVTNPNALAPAAGGAGAGRGRRGAEATGPLRGEAHDDGRRAPPADGRPPGPSGRSRRASACSSSGPGPGPGSAAAHAGRPPFGLSGGARLARRIGSARDLARLARPLPGPPATRGAARPVRSAAAPPPGGAPLAPAVPKAAAGFGDVELDLPVVSAGLPVARPAPPKAPPAARASFDIDLPARVSDLPALKQSTSAR